jgi:hypothetical protein
MTICVLGGLCVFAREEKDFSRQDGKNAKFGVAFFCGLCIFAGDIPSLVAVLPR